MLLIGRWRANWKPVCSLFLFCGLVVTPRLGLHVAIFPWTIPQRTTFFWYWVNVAIVSTYLCWCSFFYLCWHNFFFSSIHFCDWIPFIRADCGLSSIFSIRSTLIIYVNYCYFTLTISLFSIKMCGEKYRVEYTDTATLTIYPQPANIDKRFNVII